MRSKSVVLVPSNPRYSSRLCKSLKVRRVEKFSAHAAVERLAKRIIGRLSRSGKIDLYVPPESPLVNRFCNEFRAVIAADRAWFPSLSAYVIKHAHDVERCKRSRDAQCDAFT